MLDAITLNTADYAIIGIVLLSALISIFRGFLKETLSLASWAVAITVGLSFSSSLAYMLEDLIKSPEIRQGLAFFLLFVVSLVVGALVNYILGNLIKKTFLSGTDRVLGAVFGIARGTLVIAAGVLVANYTSFPQSTWWQASQIIPYVTPVAGLINDHLPENLRHTVQAETEPTPKQDTTEKSPDPRELLSHIKLPQSM